MDLFRNVKIHFESEAEENKQQKSMKMFTQFSLFWSSEVHCEAEHQYIF